MYIQKKKKNLDTDLPPFTEINPKWIIDINASCKTIQLLGKSIKKKNLGLSLVVTL